MQSLVTAVLVLLLVALCSASFLPLLREWITTLKFGANLDDGQGLNPEQGKE